MRRVIVLAGILGASLSAAPVQPARNVVLLLADAAGIPTINAASRFGYNEPRRLFVQRMPFIALSETSTASQWVTDSAAGMTAIVTGIRTHNGVLAEGPDAVRGKRDGAPLKTLLDYAEEHGLSTGVITNDSVAGATPAALYARVNERSRYGDIVLQAFQTRSGNGLDVLIGPSRAERDAVAKTGRNLESVAKDSGRPLYASLSAVPADASQAFVFTADDSFDLGAAVDLAVRLLSKNPRGFFLMVESDAHTDRPEKGLRRLVEFDRIIEGMAGRLSPDTAVAVYGGSFLRLTHPRRRDRARGARGARPGVTECQPEPAASQPASRRHAHRRRGAGSRTGAGSRACARLPGEY